MGANKQTSDNREWFSITSKGITRNFQKPDKTPGDETEERVNQNGKTVYEKFYKSLTGMLHQVAIRYNENLKCNELIVSLKDGDQILDLQINYEHQVAKRIICSLGNIDPQFPVDIAVKTTKKDDKTNYDVFITQKTGGDISYIKQTHTKENLPPWEEVWVNNKKQYDRTKELKVFEKIVSDYSKNVLGRKMTPENIEEFSKKPTSDDLPAPVAQSRESEAFLEGDDDDLPF